jgi:hypothetical protein
MLKRYILLNKLKLSTWVELLVPEKDICDEYHRLLQLEEVRHRLSSNEIKDIHTIKNQGFRSSREGTGSLNRHQLVLSPMFCRAKPFKPSASNDFIFHLNQKHPHPPPQLPIALKSPATRACRFNNLYNGRVSRCFLPSYYKPSPELPEPTTVVSEPLGPVTA